MSTGCWLHIRDKNGLRVPISGHGPCSKQVVHVELPGVHDRRGMGAPPRPPDQYYRAWLARRLLEEWRAADQTLRRSTGSDGRVSHERAVSVALDHLDRFKSVDELVEHYTSDRFRRDRDSGSPPDGTVESWAADACAAVEGAPTMDPQLVIGAALWRRARLLMEQPAH
jgi:hypothetical protein